MRFRCLVIALALVAAFASDSRGQSKQPTPPPAQPAQTNQASKPNERGTEQSPVIVKILPTKESEEKAAADAHREDEKTENDRRLARFTELLFWATCALSVIALFQLIVFGWQGIQLQRAVSAAKEAAELGNKEFISTHRPKLIVRQFLPDPFIVDQPIIVQLSIVNTGNTNATWRLSAAEIALWAGDHWEAPGIESFQQPVTPPRIIRNGQRVSAIIQSRFNLTEVQLDQISDRHLTVCAVGEFTYTDDLGTERRTGFRRNYDPAIDMFAASKNEEQEYQD